MTKWISVKSAAEKYGTTEEVIHSLIRLRYITFSFVNDHKLGGDCGTKLMMVNDEEMEEALEFNTVASLPSEVEEESIVRIPFAELNDLLEINDNLREANKALSEELERFKNREEKQGTLLEWGIKLRSRIVSLGSRCFRLRS